ncbi:MAG: FtsX-like permease family protein [Oscillospiraceae bacterium]|nr:FtsX-like permease family protein [Oscillospiraceae bacterium]
MNILSKVTLRQMRLNKRRTIVTIVGVIISVAMFTAVSTLSGSFLDFMQRAVIASEGDYHLAVFGASNGDLQTIGQNENTKSYYAVHQDGLAQLPKQFGAKHFLSVKSITKDTMTDAGIHLTEGRLPQNDRELVVSQSVKARDDSYYHIGQTVTLELGERKLKQPQETDEGIINTLEATDSYQGENEVFRPRETKTYTIVGFANMIPQEQSYLPSLTAVTALDTEKVQYQKTLDVFIQAKTVDQNIYAWGESLCAQLSCDDVISYNSSLLMFQGVNEDVQFMRTIYSLVAILFVIIFIGSVALIYNAFAISVTERSVDFGLLSSIGATKRQRRHAVLLEAVVILLIAVPLGILGGYLGLWGVFAAVNPAVSALASAGYVAGTAGLDLGLRVVPSWASVAVAAGLSVVTVLLSAWIPAVRAGRVSPIEAIRQTKDIQLTPRSVKTSPVTRALFGISGDIAAKNMKRNKKRYRIAIASFVISLVLFLSASSFTYFLNQSVDVAIEEANYQLSVSLWEEKETTGDNGETAKLLKDTYEKIRQIDGVTAGTMVSGRVAMQLEKPSLLTEKAKQIQERMGDVNGGKVYVYIQALDDESFREYCSSIGADDDSLQKTDTFSGILVNDLVWKENKEYTTFPLFALKAQDTLTLPIPVYGAQSKDFGVSNETFHVAKLTGTVPRGSSATRMKDTGLYADIFVSEAVFAKWVAPHLSGSQPDVKLYFTASDSAKAADAIEELLQSPEYRNISSYCYDMTSEVRMIQQLLFLINTFSYVFIALISAIGVANVFNTISTSIILRRREFAMLKSVGMSPGGFRKMLFFESLFYGLKSLLWGLPISFGVMLLMYFAMENNFHMAFSVPWLQVFIGIGAIFVIVLMTVLYASRKVRKENIMDGLRDRNL